MIGYKLFRKRQDGTYSPLFINKKQRLVPGIEYNMEDHPTKGFAHRPGWHICTSIEGAPHIKQDGKTGANRVWCKVEFEKLEELKRSEKQGGLWYLGKTIKILKEHGTTTTKKK